MKHVQPMEEPPGHGYDAIARAWHASLAGRLFLMSTSFCSRFSVASDFSTWDVERGGQLLDIAASSWRRAAGLSRAHGSEPSPPGVGYSHCQRGALDTRHRGLNNW